MWCSTRNIKNQLLSRKVLLSGTRDLFFPFFGLRNLILIRLVIRVLYWSTLRDIYQIDNIVTPPTRYQLMNHRAFNNLFGQPSKKHAWLIYLSSGTWGSEINQTSNHNFLLNRKRFGPGTYTNVLVISFSWTYVTWIRSSISAVYQNAPLH